MYDQYCTLGGDVGEGGLQPTSGCLGFVFLSFVSFDDTPVEIIYQIRIIVLIMVSCLGVNVEGILFQVDFESGLVSSCSYSVHR